MRETQWIEEIKQTQRADVGQLVPILQGGADEALFRAADEVRQQTKGETVWIRAILEFSNVCRCHCRYCGLRAENTKLQRYRMTEQEIVETALAAWRIGYQTIVLQSGEDPVYDTDTVCRIVQGIKQNSTMSVTLSIGELPETALRAMRQAGADRYLLKQEVADPGLYAQMHPGASQRNRLRCLRDLKRLGYETGSGFMIGLPGQTEEMIARDLLLLQELRCDMAGIGPFLPHPDTPLHSAPAGSARMTKRAVALARLLLPEANLPATTALGVLDSEEKNTVFSCGANVVMRKVTPWTHRRDYEIYPVAWREEESMEQGRRELEQTIRSLGRIPV